MAKVDAHDVIIGGLSKSNVNHRITQSGIFSTLPHGDINILFPSTGGQNIKIKSQNTRKEDKTFEAKGKFNSDVSDEVTQAEVKDLNSIPEPISYPKLIEMYQGKGLIFNPLSLDLEDSRNQFILDYIGQVYDSKSHGGLKAFLTVDDTLQGQINFDQGLHEEIEPLTIKPLGIDLKDPRNIHLLRELEPNIPSLISLETDEELKPIESLEEIVINIKNFLEYLTIEKNLTQSAIAEQIFPRLKKGTRESYLSYLKNRGYIFENHEKDERLIRKIWNSLTTKYDEEYKEYQSHR